MQQIQSESLMVMPIERKDGTFVLRLCVNQGLLTPGMLQRVMEVMAKYELSALRATTGQRFNLEGIPKDKLDEVVASIGTAVPKAPPGVSVCPGTAQCRFGIQETRDMGDKLLALIKANAPYPYKVKSGVSGCSMACGLSFVRDIGFVGKAKGWDVYFGSNAGSNAGVGIQLGTQLSDDEALAAVSKALAYYKANGKKRERTATMLYRLGAETVAAQLK